jgi:hypothetical protein
MASLVPCTACRRHVRRNESKCRFCGAELVPSAGAREISIPRDAKRATIFALGLTLAGQACGGEADVPVTPPPGVGASGGAGGGNGTGGTPNGGASNTAGQAGENNAIPVYGAPSPPEVGGSSGAAGNPGLPDASAPRDAGDADSGDAGG